MTFRNYNSSDSSYYDYHMNDMRSLIDKMRRHDRKVTRGPFMRAEILNGTFEQSTGTSTAGYNQPKEQVDTQGQPTGQKSYRIRFIEEAQDGGLIYTPTSQMVHPSEVGNAELRAVIINLHPECYPEPGGTILRDFAAGEIIRVYYKNNLWYYDNSALKLDALEWEKGLKNFQALGVNPQNAFANPGASPAAISKGAHPMNSSNTNKRSKKIGEFEMVVVHYSAGWSVEGTLRTLNSRKLAYHFICDYNGEITQFHPEDQAAAHAPNVNSKAFGFNFVNYGYCRGDNSPCKPYSKQKNESTQAAAKEYLTKKMQRHVYGKYPFMETVDNPGPLALHEQFGRPKGNAKFWAGYSEQQITKGATFLAELLSRWEINPENIYTHSNISTSGKADPGPAFPWQRFKDLVKAQWKPPTSNQSTSTESSS